MSMTSTKIDFTRAEFVASMRVLLVGFCEWAEQVLQMDVIARSVDSAQQPVPDLSAPHSAGPIIEGSYFLERMQEVFDFVMTGVWDTEGLDEFGHELLCYRTLCDLRLESHIGNALAPSIDFPRLPNPQTMCWLVLDHAEARWALLRGDDLTLVQIALLAGLAEKTVRMAANPKNENPLKTYKDGHNTYVRNHDALQWLSSRPDFVPTRMTNDDLTAREYPSVMALAHHCKQLRERQEWSREELFDRLRWPKSAQRAYLQLEDESPSLDPRPLTVPMLMQLGESFGLAEPGRFAANAAKILAPIAIDIECTEATGAATGRRQQSRGRRAK